MWDQGDSLSHLLRPLRLRGAYVSDWRLRQGWGVRGEREPRALLHYMLQGSGVVRITGEPIRYLSAGDLAIFPRGASHTIAEDVNAVPRTIDELLPDREPGGADVLNLGRGRMVGRMVCAGLDYAPQGEYPLYRTLPNVLIARSDQIQADPTMAHTLAGLMSELDEQGSGTHAVLLRIFEMVFVLGLRSTLQAMDPPAPISRALAHPSIGRVLIAMYEDYARPWSIPELAAIAQMSRSAFAIVFKDIVGETPARHLRLRRLAEARRLIETTSLSQEAIAHRVGYRSAVGLHIAFRQTYDASPGSLRGDSAAQVS
ncbi:AraC family transcriptional regulator [Luteipulveratus mongoliensis]|uniref:HTH araC/xylS-type domain-containing protein n=1 Tax=Luteipulveratus mongoliensis TaxID=571913 RepID=A0A0K1JE01_9MICO|nr:cupin domain-containing protein [Luteipulveratus mongoliensis]AKU14815.1 hypothetical protein VV02_01260 [Luteipulveratus mongoliensis]